MSLRTKLINIARWPWQKLGSPSLFDIGVCVFVVLLPLIHKTIVVLDSAMVQGLFLVYSIVVLLCIAMATEPQRKFASPELAMVVLFALANIFRVSFGNQGEVATQWIIWSLMNDGFMFILFGVMFIWLVVKYARAYRWYYVALVPVVVFHILWSGFSLQGFVDGHAKSGYFDWSMSLLLMPLVAGFLIYIRLGKWKLVTPVTVALLMGMIYKWDYIWKIKWISKPSIWAAVISRIRLLGQGFYQTINTWRGFVSPEHTEFNFVLDRWGMAWRNNDLFEFAEYVGLIAAVALVVYFVKLLALGRVGIAYFLVLSTLLVCLFHRTLFFMVPGGEMLVMIALLEIETKEKNNEMPKLRT